MLLIIFIILYFIIFIFSIFAAFSRVKSVIENSIDVSRNIIIPPSGLTLDNDFCIFRYDTVTKTCYVKDKPIGDAKGYWTYKFKYSLRIYNFLESLMDLFDNKTQSIDIRRLSNLHGIIYTSDFTELKSNIEPQKPIEKEESQEIEPTLNNDELTMPILKVSLDDDSAENKYNDEREVDL